MNILIHPQRAETFKEARQASALPGMPEIKIFLEDSHTEGSLDGDVDAWVLEVPMDRLVPWIEETLLQPPIQRLAVPTALLLQHGDLKSIFETATRLPKPPSIRALNPATNTYDLASLFAEMHLRREHDLKNQTYIREIGTLVVDLNTGDTKTKTGVKICFGPREAFMFARMALDFPNPSSRENLFNSLHKGRMPVESRGVDVMIGRLRKKLADEQTNIKIEPVRNIGYRLALD